MRGPLILKKYVLSGFVVALLLDSVLSISATDFSLQVLRGHVPAVLSHLSSKGNLASSKALDLAIGLLPRDEKGLDVFLTQVYDPASPHYRQFLTPDQFADQFGPSAADYEKVAQFARANGLTVTKTYRNRLILDVSGSVDNIQKAFHVILKTYHHPTENRDFFAPDREPSVEATLPVADIQGLSDFSKPHPQLRAMTVAAASPKSGSAPNGTGEYFGDDFRNAYVPGTTLTGAGQVVGLFQADGFYSSDIQAYASAAGGGRTNIAIQTVLLDGYDGTPTTGTGSGNPEVSLDIEMTMSMAPGLSQIILFEGNPNDFIPNDILNAMANDSTVKNLSSSWGWSGGPSASTDNIFKTMAAQGQSYFNASGDGDAFPTGYVDNSANSTVPSSSPYITQVGGTTLTTASSSYSAETVWNWGLDNGNYVGSSGGVSSYYSIPTYQQGINSFLVNGGSTTMRNIPDVALTGDNVYVQYGSGSVGDFGGTSCAAPLWAGFMALVNQQLAATTGSSTNSVGFINPAIYELANESIYASVFHDVTSGSNAWPTSPNAFYAVSGYDLCTGLGTPAGTNLINALVSPDPLVVVSNGGFSAVGTLARTFNISAETFYLTNAGNVALTWSLMNTSTWLNVSSSGGTLAAGTSGSVVVSLNNVASNLTAGVYSANLWFSNNSSGVAHSRFFTLTTADPLGVAPTNTLNFFGPSGGPFMPSNQSFTLTNAGSSTVNWSLNNTSAWFNVSPVSGSLAGGTQVPVTVSLTATASNLPNGIYTALLQVTNLASQFVQVITGSILVGQSLVLNGGFETGDFTGWTLAGDGAPYNFADNGTYVTPHSGNYAAALGENGSTATLSQSLSTVAGQKYLLSFWLDNAVAGSSQNREQFSASWNGTTLYSRNNPPVFGWTDVQFVVTATGASTILSFVSRNDPYYFGLDDVSVTPGYGPSISVQPAADSIVVGGTASFSVTSSGSAPLAYQWRLNGTNLTNGATIAVATISGATSSVLTVAPVAMGLNGGNYSVVITNLFGSATSASAALTVTQRSSVIALASSENPSGFRDNLNFTASVTPSAATGSVQFFTNGTAFDAESLAAGSATSISMAGLPRGTNLVMAVYAGDANDYPATNTLVQIVTNHPPAVVLFSTNRYAGLPLSLPITSLAANWSDADGDTVSLVDVSPSTNGVTLVSKAGVLFYANPNNVADQFVCTVTDGWGGTNYQTVDIAVVPLPNNALPSINGLTQSGGSVSLNLAGAPGFTYVLEATADLVTWQPVATNTLATNGVWQFSGTIANLPQQFYRLQIVQ
jgi:hypothetical protein